LNSFKHIQQAVELEITKQLEYFLEYHDFKTNQDTVLFDEDAGKLSVMRKKEQEADYRFMSEPNIPVISYKSITNTTILSPFLMQQQLISG
jgi:aspartyl-tRNA synthetase